MKPRTFNTGRVLLGLLITGATFALVSWNSNQSTDRIPQHPVNDTVPKAKTGDREKKILDLDDVLDELNEADMKVDMEKIQRQINESMKELDAGKIKMEMDKAMKGVDMDKIQKEVQESIAKIDMSKINGEIANAMKGIDAAKLQQEVRESMQKIDWEKMKTEMDEVKKIDMNKLDAEMQKMQEEMKDLGPRIEKEMEKAKGQIEKAKTEMKEYKEFVNGLESDGLINKKEAYTIRHKDGELIVNGKKVSNEVYSKYRSFLEKHKKFNIEKNDDDFNIDKDQ